MQASFLTRLVWRLEDLWELSLAPLRARVNALRGTHRTKVIAGMLSVLLVVAGFVAARTIARAPDGTSNQAAPGVLTVQRRVLQRVGGHLSTQLRLRTVYAHRRTVIRSPEPRTLKTVRIVATPDGAAGKTHTVLSPVTDTQSRTSTRLITVTHPVTILATTTVLSTKTVSVPAITVTVPLPTGP